jgi:hypothetical protein
MKFTGWPKSREKFGTKTTKKNEQPAPPSRVALLLEKKKKYYHRTNKIRKKMSSRKTETMTKRPYSEFIDGFTDPEYKIELREIENSGDNYYRCYLPDVGDKTFVLGGAYVEVDMKFSRLFVISREEKWEKNLADKGCQDDFDFDRHGQNLGRLSKDQTEILNNCELVTEYNLKWSDTVTGCHVVNEIEWVDGRSDQDIYGSWLGVKYDRHGLAIDIEWSDGCFLHSQSETAEAREIPSEEWEDIAREIYRLAVAKNWGKD